MIKVGLTGGIGSGKSTVAKLFELLGIPVYYSDKEAKRLMRESSELRTAIQTIFGENIYQNEVLNRKKLAQIVFNDENALQQLNALVHPVVREDFTCWAEQQDTAYVIEESAILFETGLCQDFDVIISVLCDKEERITRLLNRDKTTKEQILARMAAQVDDEIRKEKSDYVLKNGKDDLLLSQVIAVDKALRERI